ncbi:dCTP deaminase domain-containing protein [Ruegeria sp. MALMAid1280]|uniref:dCTP deaminase domain-containing protein n=1 Tax=Ruegeria sp. MALMAid1280 TaxID=3411634 RepID=UPI003BA26AAA
MATLSNVDLEKEIGAGRLLTGTDDKMVEGSSYQLRLGNVYYDLSENGKRFELAYGETILIKPGHRVVLITKEEFDVPANIVSRVVSKGSLFSIGLSPVATYADPGFSGNLGIVTQNFRNSYIQLSQGEPIAKADFSNLSNPATKLYRGQHGFQAEIWPIKTHLQKTHSEVANDDRVFSEKDEALALLPEATKVIIRRLEGRVLWLLALLVLAIGINGVALYLVETESELLDDFYGVLGSLIASGIVAVLALVVGFLGRTK